MIKISTPFYEKEIFDSPILSCQKWPSKYENLEFQKNQVPPLAPQFLMKSPINMNDNVPHFEKISVPFFDLGEISCFDSFLTVKKLSKNCQNEISRLNQKMVLRFFQNVEHFLSYLLGISSKIGGKWGHLVFFGLKVFILWRSFLTRKNWRIKKFFFLIRSTNLYHNDPQ